MSTIILWDLGKITSHREIAESIESSRFVSHRERMSGEFDSRKDSQSKKFEQKAQIFVKDMFKKHRQDCKHPKNAQFDIYAITSNFFNKFQ